MHRESGIWKVLVGNLHRWRESFFIFTLTFVKAISVLMELALVFYRAWTKITAHPRFGDLTLRDFASLTHVLSAKVECYGWVHSKHEP